MRIAVVGLGKLGLPVALTLAKAGHEVMGWDASEERRHQIVYHEVPEMAHEPHLAEYLQTTEVPLLPIPVLIENLNPDVVLVCVQTPHEPEFEGVTPLDRLPQDFDYRHLRTAVAEVGQAIEDSNDDPLVVIVSTCLPGTFEREISPLADEYGLRMAYHPLFIAMGSVIEDFCNPEFVLVGADEGRVVPDELLGMYGPLLDWRLTDPRWCEMSITSAELAKVAYNAAIGFKLLLANSVAELSDAVGANADDVMGTLKQATKRLVSTAYMNPGMGDGGGCHPRDQIALSWLAIEHDAANPYGSIIQWRETHARWLARVWCDATPLVDVDPPRGEEVPMIMLGTAYKANSRLTTGSHARLVAHYARESGHDILEADEPLAEYPVACYFLAAPHDHFLRAELPEGSVLVDPWGVFAPISEFEYVEVIRPGRRVV